MIATPGNMHQFASHERKEVRFCWRQARKRIAAFLRFSKSANEHQQIADSVEEFLTGEYHNAHRS